MHRLTIQKSEFMKSRNTQSGVMLLEALIGILVFSLGILALVGMQTVAMRVSADARDRTEASNLASEIIGQMWLIDRTVPANIPALLNTYAYNGGGSPPAAVAPWVARVNNLLPGVAANQPTIVVAPSAIGVTVGTEVIVTVSWQNPTDASAHTYSMSAFIN